MFRQIEPTGFEEKVFKLIGSDWMLVTAGVGDRYNTMTASWGGLGVLWHKNVAYVFIRPSRYTYRFAEESDRITLSFFSEDYREALKICGSVSGRDTDKVAKAGLTPVFDEEGVYFQQARLVIICKKLYCTDLDEGKIPDHIKSSCYISGDYHRMYICEVEKILAK